MGRLGTRSTPWRPVKLEISPISVETRFLKVTRPSFFWGGYHPTLKLSGIPTSTFIVSLTHRMDNI